MAKKPELPADDGTVFRIYYDLVVNADTFEEALRCIEAYPKEIGITPELQGEIRNGDHGVRLKGIVLMALGRAGKNLTWNEQMFIHDNFDEIK